METLIAATMTWSGLGQMIWNGLLVALMLGFVIFIHELGHFLVAKMCGVKCEKFYVGFDAVDIPLGFMKIPRALVKFQWGETEYGIGSIPLGGYVKMLGQDDNPGNAEAENKRIQVLGLDGKSEFEGKPILDPRSYPAKPVLSRMAIISAGVVMNIISGVFLCAIAYRMGVDYVPAEFGQTLAGEPAWAAGLLPGDRVLQIGRNGTPNPKLRFDKDLTMRLALTDFKQDVELLIQHADGREQWVKLLPSERLKDEPDSRPTLGVITPSSNLIHGVLDVHREFYSEYWKDLQEGDEIIAADGEKIADGYELKRYLNTHFRDPIELTIRRTEKTKDGKENVSEHKITSKPVPMRDFGFTVEFGEVFGVQPGSPAEKAGVQKGDMLTAFHDWESLGDPLSFPQRALDRIGQATKLTVTRGKETHDLTIEPRTPTQSQWGGAAGNIVACDTLGIAYVATNTVAAVAENGPAAGKLKQGDILESFTIVPHDDAERKKLGELLGNSKAAIKELLASHFLDGKKYGIPIVVDLADGCFPTTSFHFEYKRGQENGSTKIVPIVSQESFLESRKLPLDVIMKTRTTTSWSEGISLGVREMKERMFEVVTVLGRLVTGKAKATNLGGPLLVISQAAGQASDGIPSLLMFFAFISANLAVINFLPIPALDGGHMMFLTYEAIRGKPVNEEIQIKLSIIGILSLLSLMAFVTLLDIQRFFL